MIYTNVLIELAKGPCITAPCDKILKATIGFAIFPNCYLQVTLKQSRYQPRCCCQQGRGRRWRSTWGECQLEYRELHCLLRRFRGPTSESH